MYVPATNNERQGFPPRSRLPAAHAVFLGQGVAGEGINWRRARPVCD